MMKRPFALRAAALLCAVLLTEQALAARVFTDMAGRTLTLPDEIHKVYAVGHCVPIVGAMAPDLLTNNFRLPDRARRFLAPAFFEGKTTPNAGIRFSDEEILRMTPDLVVMETTAGAADRAARLQARLQVPVILIDQDLFKYKETFAFLGDALNRQAQAQRMTGFVTRYLDPIPTKAARIPPQARVRVYYAEGPDGLSTNPAGSTHTQVLDVVGGLNVAQVTNLPDEGQSKVSLEQIYLWKPQVILVWTPAAETLTTWRVVTENPLWQRLDAVREGRVVQIPWLPFSWFDRPPGTNRIIGTLWLAELLYPDRFDIDLVTATQEYVRIFYHREISPDEARELLSLAHPGRGSELR